MTALRAAPGAALNGDIAVPGDKSISHRALMIGAVAVGRSEITGLLEAEDVLATAAALGRLGVAISRGGDGVWRVDGVGVGGLAEPDDVLDLGNSGTGARLLMGLVATHPVAAHFTGDASLRRRPMDRIARPITQMGAEVIAREGGRMPLLVRGAAEPIPIAYTLPMPSAQVKSAVLLAGLNAPGETSVIESLPARDHTELMLRHFGADVAVCDEGPGRRVITLKGEPELTGGPVRVPGDVSSAAFPGIAALVTPGSELRVRNVGLNPLRAGIIETLGEMGADIVFSESRIEAGEPVADLVFRHGPLTGVDVPAERAPRMIDEYPILAVAAAAARGRTRMFGLGELRVKESDRLAAIAAGLAANGVASAIEGDTLIVEGAGGPPPGGGMVATHYDHRIAMAFLVLGLGARAAVAIDDDRAIATSFPGFVALMAGLGADIAPADGAA